MADNRTMGEMLQAPMEGYGDAIVVRKRTTSVNLDMGGSRIEIRESFLSPLKTIHLKNEITRFNQKFKETFREAWERFKKMLRQCPHHGFSELHQINTFYNGLNELEYDSINAVAGGNLLIQNGFSNEFDHYMKRNDDNMRIMQSQMNNMNTEFQSTLRIQNNKIDQNQNEIKKMFACLMNNPSGSEPLPSNTIANPRVDFKVPEVTQDTVQPSTENIQPLAVQTQVPIDEPVVAPNPKPTIPYPSRANKQKLQEKDDIQALKFVEIFRNLHFNLSFIDALLHMPKFALMFKSLLNNKEKLFDLATTPVNENC
nr:hypothetical protein [Tanacetum cinerariifolium]